jgi:hypothetical protein
MNKIFIFVNTGSVQKSDKGSLNRPVTSLQCNQVPAQAMLQSTIHLTPKDPVNDHPVIEPIGMKMKAHLRTASPRLYIQSKFLVEDLHLNLPTLYNIRANFVDGTAADEKTLL